MQKSRGMQQNAQVDVATKRLPYASGRAMAADKESADRLPK